MGKKEIFEYCLAKELDRFRECDRKEKLENKYENAQHDEELQNAAAGDFTSAMARLGIIKFDDSEGKP